VSHRCRKTPESAAQLLPNAEPDSALQAPICAADPARSASQVLAGSRRQAQYAPPSVVEPRAEPTSPPPDASAPHDALSDGRVKQFVRLAVLICRWTYERVALSVAVLAVICVGAASLARAAPPEATPYQIAVDHAGVTASGGTLALQETLSGGAGSLTWTDFATLLALTALAAVRGRRPVQVRPQRGTRAHFRGLNVVNPKLGAVLILAVVATAGRVAYAADAGYAHTIVPSRGTVGALAKLSEKSDVIADVLTVDRKEYVLKLDGGGNGALSGRATSPESVSEVAADAEIETIPFERLALVYYSEVPKGRHRPGRLIKAAYPSLAPVGAAEHGLDCGELNLDLARSATIRWYARQYAGALPFTEHEARMQHGKNAVKDVGVGLLVAVLLIGMAGGGGGSLPCLTDCSPAATPISMEDFRWAMTAADRREIGLLQLKRDRLCPAVATSRGETNDLEILTRIETTRRGLEAHQISDQDQINQQTRLLDQFDPATAVIERVPSAAELAAGFETVTVPLEEGAVTAYPVVWFAAIGDLPSFRDYIHTLDRGLRGSLELTDRSLTLVSESSNGVKTGFGVHIPFSEIASVEIRSYGLTRVVELKHRDGHLDSFQIRASALVSRKQTDTAADLLRSKVQAQLTTAGSP
jgi:hypothetical protein